MPVGSELGLFGTVKAPEKPSHVLQATFPDGENTRALAPQARIFREGLWLTLHPHMERSRAETTL